MLSFTDLAVENSVEAYAPQVICFANGKGASWEETGEGFVDYSGVDELEG